MNSLFLLSLLLPVFAQQTPAGGVPAASAGRPGLDPNQTICRRYRESGSRIAIRRTCMTRQEWVDLNRELRQNVDRAQLTRVIGGK